MYKLNWGLLDVVGCPYTSEAYGKQLDTITLMEFRQQHGGYIGGYQPAQKWLKDRRGRELTFDDILHYQKIIVALNETNKLMQEIDKIKLDQG